MTSPQGNVLFVSPFKSTRGYAWDFIGRLYARVADHLATHGISTFVAYPSIPAPPPALEGSTAQPILLDASLSTGESLRATIGLIRRKNIKVIHFISHPAWSWHYPRLRRAGVRRIITYDHESGEYTRPTGLKRAVKWALVRTPGLMADVVLAVSNFVAHRQVDVGLVPKERVVTLWNGIPVIETEGAGRSVHVEFGIAENRAIVVCNCRATPEKGVHHLLRAFDLVMKAWDSARPQPVLIYMGDGPYLSNLRSLVSTLAARQNIVFAGYRADAKAIVEGADLCVVPSVWQDAFPLAVLEAMARRRPVIATRVGGIPEMIEDRVTGLLVPPGDEEALAAAILNMLTNPDLAVGLGAAARQRVSDRFSPKNQFVRLATYIEEGFGKPCPELSNSKEN